MLNKQRRKLIIPFLAPSLILYLVFFIYPTIQGLGVSLDDWSGFKLPLKFIGLLNFKNLLTMDDNFVIALKNSMYLFFVGGFVIFAVAFLFTSFLSSGIKAKNFFRGILFFPNVIAPIAVVTIWQFLYNPRFGLLNGFLNIIGLGQFDQSWAAPGRIFPAITVIITWMAIGYYLVLLLAAADKIPQDVYDAGRVDGANTWQMFWLVTLPMIWDVIGILLVLWMISAMKQFEIAYAFSSTGSVPPESYTLPIYVVVEGFGMREPIYRLGYASAVGCVLLFIVVILTIVIRRLFKREAIQY
jgi:ABC-type sugar transport system permease subunit